MKLNIQCIHTKSNEYSNFVYYSYMPEEFVFFDDNVTTLSAAPLISILL